MHGAADDGLTAAAPQITDAGKRCNARGAVAGKGRTAASTGAGTERPEAARCGR